MHFIHKSLNLKAIDKQGTQKSGYINENKHSFNNRRIHQFIQMYNMYSTKKKKNTEKSVMLSDGQNISKRK